MPRLFGTDGVRGKANVDLTAELALELSVAAAHALGETGAFGSRRPQAIVGQDSRISGQFLEAAVVAGLLSAGVDVTRVGIIPTPGTAYLVEHGGYDLGVMLSASHNPMPDNGIKFFQRGGVKLDDGVEDAVESRLGEKWQRPVGGDVGRVSDDPEALESYIAHLVASLGASGSLEGLTIVLDCANGASSVTAKAAFESQGATVIAINAAPNGLNINDDAGSTHIEGLQRTVVERGAQMGLAFDGDADRCLAVDHTGAVIDGDHILAVLALAMKRDGKLPGDTVVATVMSNLGFINAMRERGVHVDQTKVGDRYVLESMNANGFALGGEQSGHVIMSDYATTGDGVLTGLHLAAEVVGSGETLHDLASVMTQLPQHMINIRGVDKARVNLDPVLAAAVRAESSRLGTTGRILLRPSGTEPLVRVMAEAATLDDAVAVCERLAVIVEDRLAL